jgi:hypothetical protein
MVRFLSVVFTGLALVAPMAHLFELVNKMALSGSEYFTVQKIHNGWWMTGLLLPVAALLNLLHAYEVRGSARTLAVVAALCLMSNLVVFFVWAQPTNVATENWMVEPANWEMLRRQWEFSHAANALITLLAFCLSTASALSRW